MLACRSCELAAPSRSELGNEIPTSPRPSQDAHDGPMVHPYELQARGSARSHANGWRVCRGMLEHAPTLTASIARRGASVSGCSAAKSRPPSRMTRRGRERRQERQPSSRPSSVTMTRLRDHLAASTTTHMTLTASACVLARGRQDDPRSQLQGIEATPSRLGGGLHLPRAGRSRLASLLRACGGHASRLSPRPWPCVMEGRHASGSRNRKALHWVKSSVGSMCIGSATEKKD